MADRDSKLTALLFNDCVNRRDIEGLARLMTEGHSLVCDGHRETNDKEESVRVWSQFFEQFPDYRNHFTTVRSEEDRVAMAGHSSCSHSELDGPALWSARVVRDLIVEWEVFEDNTENRRRLSLPLD